MNWFLMGLVWLGASLAFSLGWAAVMAAERRYCEYCSHVHQLGSGNVPDHAHVWSLGGRAVR